MTAAKTAETPANIQAALDAHAAKTAGIAMPRWVTDMPLIAVTCPFNGKVRVGRLQHSYSKWTVVFWDTPEVWTSTEVRTQEVTRL